MKLAFQRTQMQRVLMQRALMKRCVPVTVCSLLSFSGALCYQASASADTASNKNAVSIKLRNHFQDRKPTDANDLYTDADKNKVKTQDRQRGWGQGMEINFDSAWFGSDEAGIGMDLSLYGGLKLMGDSDQYGSTINKEGTPYYDKKSQSYRAEQDSYGKLGQAYVKGFAGVPGRKISARAGWHRIDRTLVQTSYRLTPSSFQGVSVDSELGYFDLYGSWYDKVSRSNHDRFEQITSPKAGKSGASGEYETIDYAYTVGGKFSHDSGLGSELAYAESESYLKLYHASLNYTFDLSESAALLVDGRYYKGEGNGSKWKDNVQTYGGFDSSASLYNLNARLSMDMFAFNASYSQVDAEKKGALGQFDYNLGYDSGHDYSDLGYWTNRQISGFNHNGERVWQAGVSYAFDRLGAPGLKLGYTYTQGDEIKTGNASYTSKYKESEHDIELGYAFQQRQLQGLSFKVQYANYKADKALSEVKHPSRKDYHDDGATDLRVYVDYTLSVF